MFQYKNQSFMVFEVDTTDLEKKRLSTLIVKGNYEISESDELLEEIVRTSLSWSKLPFVSIRPTPIAFSKHEAGAHQYPYLYG